MMGGKYLRAEIVHKKSTALISDPLFNKGLAYPKSERDRLGIRGLIPQAELAIDQQSDIVMEEYKTGWAARAAKNPNDEILKSGVNPDDIRKWNVLQALQDRNETLFYR